MARWPRSIRPGNACGWTSGPRMAAEGRFLSPWVPYAQFSGALRVHTPPTVGQQFTAMSPTGDFQQAVAVPLTHSTANPSPSTAAEQNVLSFGDVETYASGLTRGCVYCGLKFHGMSSSMRLIL